MHFLRVNFFVGYAENNLCSDGIEVPSGAGTAHFSVRLAIKQAEEFFRGCTNTVT